MIRLVPPIMTPTPFEAMVGWLNDPEVVRYSEQRHKIHTIESQIAYVKSFTQPNIINMIIADDTIIGTITAHVDTHNSVADIGILIGHKPSWGKGHGTKAWIIFCDDLFASGIRKIEAGCMINNLGMITICERYGMANEGIRRSHFIQGGHLVHGVMWGKFREAV